MTFTSKFPEHDREVIAAHVATFGRADEFDHRLARTGHCAGCAYYMMPGQASAICIRARDIINDMPMLEARRVSPIRRADNSCAEFDRAEWLDEMADYEASLATASESTAPMVSL